jgi:hypothetical protein
MSTTKEQLSNIETEVRIIYTSHGIIPPKKLTVRELILANRMLLHARELDSDILIKANEQLMKERSDLECTIGLMEAEVKRVSKNQVIQAVWYALWVHPFLILTPLLIVFGLGMWFEKSILEFRFPEQMQRLR